MNVKINRERVHRSDDTLENALGLGRGNKKKISVNPVLS